MPAYLVTDAETGVGVMVDAKRARGAIRAVIESRFTACELEWQEVHALTLKGTRLINAPEAGSDADDDAENDLTGQRPLAAAQNAVESPMSAGKVENDAGAVDDTIQSPAAEDAPQFLQDMVEADQGAVL